MIASWLWIWGTVAAVAEDRTDGPHLFVHEMVAAAVRPGGLLTDTIVEGRLPVLRFGDPISNMTFVGGGARVAVTPAHVDLAARATVQLVDILPVTVEVVHSRYFDGPFAPLPYDGQESTRMVDRKGRYEQGEGFGASALTINLAPTFQIKVGPVAGFTTWTVSLIDIQQPDGVTSPFVFEPYRGMVTAWQDRLVEHTSAVVWEPLDGEDGPLLRSGAVLRGKYSWQSPDYTLTMGPVVMWRPGTTPQVPTLLMLVAPYLKDPDFMGGPPYMAIASTWTMP